MALTIALPGSSEVAPRPGRCSDASERASDAPAFSRGEAKVHPMMQRVKMGQDEAVNGDDLTCTFLQGLMDRADGVCLVFDSDTAHQLGEAHFNLSRQFSGLNYDVRNSIEEVFSAFSLEGTTLENVRRETDAPAPLYLHSMYIFLCGRVTQWQLD